MQDDGLSLPRVLELSGHAVHTNPAEPAVRWGGCRDDYPASPFVESDGVGIGDAHIESKASRTSGDRPIDDRCDEPRTDPGTSLRWVDGDRLKVGVSFLVNVHERDHASTDLMDERHARDPKPCRPGGNRRRPLPVGVVLSGRVRGNHSCDLAVDVDEQHTFVAQIMTGFNEDRRQEVRCSRAEHVIEETMRRLLHEATERLPILFGSSGGSHDHTGSSHAATSPLQASGGGEGI